MSAGCTRILFALLFMSVFSASVRAAQRRRIISHDGKWQIAQGSMDKVPSEFPARVQVPGLVDMATPPFEQVGKKSDLREAFWYRRRFMLHGEVPATAKLHIGKAKYGTKVFLNGSVVGEHLSCFTAGTFDVKEHLKGNGQMNELIIRVGAWRESVPKTTPAGWDFEKKRYIPGIYDSIRLVLTGPVHSENVQVVPHIIADSVRSKEQITNGIVQAASRQANGTVKVVAEIVNTGQAKTISPVCQIHPVAGELTVSRSTKENLKIAQSETKTVEFNITMDNCTLWSPDSPWLYEAEVSVDGDSVRTRFGMREFKFENKRPVLNGQVYPMRGTNVCIYRFFEDPTRRELPWDEKWVRKLHRKFKGMGWNSIRYCIGFPPEKWYEIADEEGLLIQDEYPLWHGDNEPKNKHRWPKELTSEHLVPEYTKWMRERWNHPCVVIWDAQNESVTDQTSPAIRKVRALDLSNRPWNAGWDTHQEAGDTYEVHPYPVLHVKDKKFTLSDLPRNFPEKLSAGKWIAGNPVPNKPGNAVINNEYGWMWLTRDGMPTTLSKEVFYEKVLGKESTVEQRRDLYTRNLAAMTEFWRASGDIAVLLHFCGLGYSRHDGQTSDNFIDVEKLVFEPMFEKRMGDAFSPLGVILDYWPDERAKLPEKIKVIVLNDLNKPWAGEVKLLVKKDSEVLRQYSKQCRVDAVSKARLEFEVEQPEKSGEYTLAAQINVAEREVQSLRDFKVAK